jgi:glycosyltransferase involved in cell wall biosynthesis
MPSIGGAERLVLDLARQDGSRVPVVTWFGADNSLVAAHGDAVDLIALRPLRIGSLLRAFRAVRDADVIHAHLFPTQYLAALLPRPILFTEHNTWNRRRDRPWLRPIEKWCYGRFAKVVVISEETGHALCEWIGRTPRELETIPNGIDLSRFDRRTRVRRQGAEFVLGMAARFAVEKDHETLLRAMPLLPAEFRLRLAGDGPRRAEIATLAATLGVEDRVEFAGVATDISAFFRTIDVYVQSARFDGFSLVSVEAMASGLPTLGSDIAGLRNTIGEPRALFTAGDPASLAACVRDVAMVPGLYSTLAAHSVAQASRFDVSVTASRYRAAYRTIARRDCRSRGESEPEER